MPEEQKNNEEILEQETEQEEELIEQKIEHYELCCIIPASYTTEETKPINEKIADLLKTQQGQITKQEDLGKLKFAYPIKNQSHGYYQLFEFDLPAENLQKINTELKLSNEILRFLIVKKKIKTEKDIKAEKAMQEKLAKKKEAEIEKIIAKKEKIKEEPARKKTKEKISLEDLDKKLDEILDTDDIV